MHAAAMSEREKAYLNQKNKTKCVQTERHQKQEQEEADEVSKTGQALSHHPLHS